MMFRIVRAGGGLLHGDIRRDAYKQLRENTPLWRGASPWGSYSWAEGNYCSTYRSPGSLYDLKAPNRCDGDFFLVLRQTGSPRRKISVSEGLRILETGKGLD